MRIIALTIAGSDLSGGAGFPVGLKTFDEHGVQAMEEVALNACE